MEGILPSSSPCGQRAGVATEAGNMGVLGSAALQGSLPVHPEKDAPRMMMLLRPIDLCQLLNSTPLGGVINERQLYRHRVRGGSRFCKGRKVNLLQYTAWLIRERRSRRSRSWGQRGGAGSISARDVLALLERQDYRCALTGRSLTPETASMDHIIAVSQGGAHSLENVQILHRQVNRAKGTNSNDEFVALCREVVRWADRDGQPQQ